MDEIEVVEEFRKDPVESYTIGIPFTGKLPAGTSLASGVFTAVDPAGTDVTATVLSSGIATIDGNEARIDVLAGVHGVDYKLLLVVTLDNGKVLKEVVRMRVRRL